MVNNHRQKKIRKSLGVIYRFITLNRICYFFIKKQVRKCRFLKSGSLYLTFSMQNKKRAPFPRDIKAKRKTNKNSLYNI